MLSGGYNTSGKVSPQGKRKRDKAQLKLRDGMRKKMHGSTVLQTRFPNPMAHTSHSLPAVTHSGPSTESSKRSLLHRDGYWRTQHDRYDKMVHPAHSTRRGEDVAIQDLVDRVAERRERQQTLQNNSLLTIRSYKRPTRPYAIQQQPLIKKMVSIPPLQQSKTSKKKGPYVLVLQTLSKPRGDQGGDQWEDHGEPGEPNARPTLSVPVSNASDNGSLTSPTGSGSEETEPTHQLPQLKTWKPKHQNIAVPARRQTNEGEERGVTNYKLEFQQANRLAEARFQYSSQHSIEAVIGSSNPTTLQKFSALPSIPSVATKSRDNDMNERLKPETEMLSDNSNILGTEESNCKVDEVNENDSKEDNAHVKKIEPFKYRKSSSNGILQVMEAKKKAKRAKRSNSDFQTLLRTRHKHTTDTKLFKDDLLNMRKLSIISETNSGTPDELKRATSAERTCSRASIASLKNVPSLEKIDEANIVRDPIGERITVPRALKSPGAIYLIKEEPGDGGTDMVSVYAPPTTPVLDRANVEEGVSSQTNSGDNGRERAGGRDSVNDGQIEGGIRWISGDEEFVEVM